MSVMWFIRIISENTDTYMIEIYNLYLFWSYATSDGLIDKQDKHVDIILKQIFWYNKLLCLFNLNN